MAIAFDHIPVVSMQSTHTMDTGRQHHLLLDIAALVLWLMSKEIQMLCHSDSDQLLIRPMLTELVTTDSLSDGNPNFCVNHDSKTIK